MAWHRSGGAWLYRGFTVRYHHRADAEAPTAEARWWAEILDAPTLPPFTGASYALVQHAAEQAIDALLAQGHAAPPARQRLRYQGLGQYLAGLPPEQQAIVLSFAAIEAVLGGPLPATARRQTRYWQQPTKAHVRGWRAVGWQARVDLRAQAVTFTRLAAQEE